MTQHLDALLVDDSAFDIELLLAHLRRNGYEVRWMRVETPVALREALTNRAWHIALCDYVMPYLSGPEAIEIVRALAPEVPVIVVSGQLGEDYPVEVMRAGARDYVRKDNLSRLVPAIERELAEAETRRQQKRAEKELRTTQALLRAVVDGTSDAVFVKDLQGRYLLCNRAAARATGRSVDEVLGKDDTLLLPAAAARTVMAGDRRVLAANETMTYEETVSTTDGTTVYLTTKGPLPDDHGEPIGLFGVARDITERKRAEEALRNSEEKFRSYTEGAPIAVIVSDEAGRILECNPAGIALWGERATAPGQSVFGLYPDDEHPAVRQALQTLAREKAVTGDFRMQRGDGTPFWASLRVRLIGSDRALGFCEDITEHKRAAETVERLAKRNRLLLSAAGQGILGLDAQGCVTFANEAAANMLGHRVDDMIGRNGHAAWHHSKLDGTPYPSEECPIHGAHSDGQTHRSDSEVFWRADGTAFPVQYVSTPVWEDGTLAGAVVVFDDITERQRTEAALRESDAKFQAIIEASPVALAVNDEHANITFVNRRFVQTFGYALDEIPTSAAWWPRAYPDPAYRQRIIEEWQGALEKVQRDGTDVELADYQVACKDGSVRDIHFSVAPLGRSYLVMLHDITERKRADDALRLSEHRFRTMFEEAPLGVALIDSLTGHIYEVNARFAEIAGRTRVELATIDWMSITHPNDVQEDLDNMARLNAGEIPGFNMAKRYLRPDGSVVWISMTIAPMRVDDRTHPRHLCMIEDITERQQVLEQLRDLSATLERRVTERTAELAAVNAALEAFAYSISHDLRAPLRHIQGFTRALEEDLGPHLPAEQRQYLEQLIDASTRMDRMITALLRLSHVERSALEIHRLNLTELAVAAFTDLHAAPFVRPVEFVVRQMPAVDGDPTLLRELLDNLLGNALKFTQPVATPRIEVGSECRDGLDVFYVRDNGVGFDPQHVTKLFGVFQRLHSDAEFEGSGVGLSIVKRIVEKHGGRVWAEGTPGAGATFSFTLSGTAEAA